MPSLHNLTIVVRPRIAYALFLLPVAFLFFTTFNDTSRQIAATRLEIAGSNYNRELFAVYDALSREGDGAGDRLAAATEAATRSMLDVSGMSDTAEEASEDVLRASDRMARTAESLHDELTRFLAGIADAGDEERRKFERISGQGFETLLTLNGGPETAVPIRDISRGGIAVTLDARVAAGTGARHLLPGADGPAEARVARAGSGWVAFAFRQDVATSRRVDAVLDRIGAAARDRAA